MTEATLASVPRADSLFRTNLRDFRSNRLAMASVIVVLIFVIMAVAAPLIAPQDPSLSPDREVDPEPR